MSQLKGRTLLAVPAARLNPKLKLFQNDKHHPSSQNHTNPQPPPPRFLVGALDQHASPAVALSDLGSAACCVFSNMVAAYQLSKFTLELSKKEKLHACQKKKKEGKKRVGGGNQKRFFCAFSHVGLQEQRSGGLVLNGLLEAPV